MVDKSKSKIGFLKSDVQYKPWTIDCKKEEFVQRNYWPAGGNSSIV